MTKYFQTISKILLESKCVPSNGNESDNHSSLKVPMEKPRSNTERSNVAPVEPPMEMNQH